MPVLSLSKKLDIDNPLTILNDCSLTALCLHTCANKQTATA